MSMSFEDMYEKIEKMEKAFKSQHYIIHNNNSLPKGVIDLLKTIDKSTLDSFKTHVLSDADNDMTYNIQVDYEHGPYRLTTIKDLEWFQVHIRFSIDNGMDIKTYEWIWVSTPMYFYVNDKYADIFLYDHDQKVGIRTIRQFVEKSMERFKKDTQNFELF